MSDLSGRWQPFVDRYTNGEWRATVLHDVILEEIAARKVLGVSPTVLDIGCGRGFDDDPALQRSLAETAGMYLGVEPDTEMQLHTVFTDVFRCPFEDAPLASESVDIAFAVMVLEHIADPQRFWDTLHSVLKKGGVFWGITVDARHPFVFFSLWMERLGIKDWYLNKMRGKKGEERYENYGVYYRTNSPETIRAYAKTFAKVEFPSFRRVDNMAYYLPKYLRWVGTMYGHCSNALGTPHSILFVRVEK